jgi:hypothetical protein
MEPRQSMTYSLSFIQLGSAKQQFCFSSSIIDHMHAPFELDIYLSITLFLVLPTIYKVFQLLIQDPMRASPTTVIILVT